MDHLGPLLGNFKDGRAPPVRNSVSEYESARAHELEVDAELEDWKAKGWMVECERHRQPTLPLMAVFQEAKAKVRPVLDYRELNESISSHTAESLVCAEKLKKWRRMGRNLVIVDLRRAYLQIKVNQSLWDYQGVQHRKKILLSNKARVQVECSPKK